MTSQVPGWPSRPASTLLGRPDARGVLISASRDPDAKLTFVITGRDQAAAEGRVPSGERLAVKIPTTAAAGEAVDREGRMLVEIRRLGLGPLASTVPRYVESLTADDRPVLVSTAVPGTPMSVGYHRWSHTLRPAAVRRDVDAAFGWLAAFQAATTRGSSPTDWPQRVLDAVGGRWDGHPALPAAADRLEAARDHLAVHRCPTTAVHGDFWFGNVMVQGGAVTGVVDWENASPAGCALRDPARFVLSYALYLDRHTREGGRVLGHPGLTRTGFGPGLRYALCGSGWLPRLLQDSLARRLLRLGLPPSLWYDVALTGLGEVAASANSDEFGAGHLEVLATLPVHARRHRRRAR